MAHTDLNALVYVPRDELERVLALECPAPEKTRLFASLCRVNALYMIAKAGSGHIGSSFSGMDIMSWLYLNEIRMTDGRALDVFFSSKGHDAPALYANLSAVGLMDFDLIHNLRRQGGPPGHPDVKIPNVMTNTGSLGMGISKAKGMAHANRLKGNKASIFVLTGDGELQEGQIWESLSTAANMGLGEITVIVDHNKIQSDTFVADTADLGDVKAKFQSFGWLTARLDGHDFHALEKRLREFKKITDRPKCIIADTVKGRGVSFMEHTALKRPGREPENVFYAFHSGAPSPEDYLKAVNELLNRANEQLSKMGLGELRLRFNPRPRAAPATKCQRLIPAYSKALLKQAGKNPGLTVLDADLLKDCGLDRFKVKYPERFFECGIAEQDMVSMAGGMALGGLLPVVHSFSCFLSARPNEHIYNNATERTRIVYVGSLAGVVPGGPGHSHQAVRDIAALGAIPGLTIMEPCCEKEVDRLFDFCCNKAQGPCYLRLTSIPCEIPFGCDAPAPTLGQGYVLRRGDDAVIFGYGPVLLSQAWRALEKLQREHGLGVKLVNLPWLNRVDEAWLGEAVKDFRAVITLDNHYVKGGQGEMLASALARMGLANGVRIKNIGLDRIPECGLNQETLAAHRLDTDSLGKDIFAFLSA
ncbi:MAG: transketolase C-terminal domain-containing protein [Thermodesulfobacteriota bacterium]|nr:transketolase C-terminal domain-containing protein [Thermodesulfobacteriota bacterium]